MTAILYPVAETAEAALHGPCGYAEREREARILAAEEAVSFVSELVGPAFATREAAQDAYARRLGPPGADAAAAEGRWRQLVPVSASPGERRAARPVLQPTYQDGHRWPQAPEAAVILWRLSISYWRIGGKGALASGALQDAAAAPVEAARRLRRGAAGRELAAPALNALARQPLRPFRLQQPLDIGLFETHLPEAPDTVIPDE